MKKMAIMIASFCFIQVIHASEFLPIPVRHDSNLMFHCNNKMLEQLFHKMEIPIFNCFFSQTKETLKKIKNEEIGLSVVSLRYHGRLRKINHTDDELSEDRD